MRSSTSPRWLATGAAAAILFAACSAASTPVPTATGAASAAPASTAAATPSSTKRVGPPPGQANGFTFAETGFGLSAIPAHAALDVLTQQGYKINIVEIADAETVTQGVASNQFQFGYGANNNALLGMSKGAKIQFVVDLVSNVWGIVALSSIKTCDQLIKQRVAIHSPGAVSTAMLNDWVNKKCAAGSTFTPLVIAGSQNRAAALLANQIDATPAELADWLNISSQAPNKYSQLADFAQDLPGLHPTSIYGNTSWMQGSADVTKDFVRELVNQNRRALSEPGYLLSIYQKYLPDEVKTKGTASATAIADAYIQKALYGVNGGIDSTSIDYTAKFFGPNGDKELPADMPVSQIADFSYLNAVLADIGKK